MTQKFESVWDAVEDTSQEAEIMKMRSGLMIEIKQYIKQKGLNQTQAAQLFGVTQPRISDLMRGKINLFGLDSLIQMVLTAGLKVEVRLAEAA